MKKESIYVRLTASEKQILENYCKSADRTKSDVIRELIRGLESKNTPQRTIERLKP